MRAYQTGRFWFIGVVLLVLSQAGNASPLTFYTDEAAWRAAVANDGIEPYPGMATITRNQVTEQLIDFGICCKPPIYSTSIGTTDFTSLHAQFSTLSIDTGKPVLLDREIIINFPTLIGGFAAHGVGLPAFSILAINGQTVPYLFRLPFLGVVGPISSLDFTDGRACPRCDDNDIFSMGDIVVAVDEPSSLPLFTIALLICAAITWYAPSRRCS